MLQAREPSVPWVPDSIVYEHIDHDSKESENEWFDVPFLVEHDYPYCSEQQIEQHEVYIEYPDDHALKLHEELFTTFDKKASLLSLFSQMLACSIEHLKDTLTGLRRNLEDLCIEFHPELLCVFKGDSYPFNTFIDLITH